MPFFFFSGYNPNTNCALPKHAFVASGVKDIFNGGGKGGNYFSRKYTPLTTCLTEPFVVVSSKKNQKKILKCLTFRILKRSEHLELMEQLYVKRKNQLA